MLKITYTESGLYLERLAQTAAAFLSQRTALNWQMECDCIVQRSYGAFLLSAHLPDLEQLMSMSQQLNSSQISLSAGDCDVMEVSLQGYWLAEQSHSAEGILVAELPVHLEILLLRLWQISQKQMRAKSAQGKLS